MTLSSSDDLTAMRAAVKLDIESEVVRSGCAVIRELTGHGIGRRIHEADGHSVRATGRSW